MLFEFASPALLVLVCSSEIDFVRDVQPILESRCWACHGAKKQRGGLRLDTNEGLVAGGESGPVFIARSSAKSSIIHRVKAPDAGERMPPSGPPLTASEIEVLSRWIDQGANVPKLRIKATTPVAQGWTWKPLERPALPALNAADAALARTPLDAFVLSKLRANGLTMSPEADRRTLLRRATLDLTGLPPLPDEYNAFLADTSADAYERLIERLLASPRYGERWARHWLDVVHYADSHGQEHDKPRANAWRYRDYIIRSFNADKPYGQFVREQVAGDVLIPGDAEALRATGFLAAGPWDESALVTIKEDTLDRRAAEYLDRDDIVCSTLSSFNALTVGCARCHDHKFDPIPQADYFALQAVFAGVKKEDRSYDPDPAIARQRAELRQEIARLTALGGKPDSSLRTASARAIANALDEEWRAKERGWETTRPARWSATDGTILKLLHDASILAVGPRPESDTYRVEIATSRVKTQAIRLEVLSDNTLPHHGPGRQDNGNLHVTEMKVFAKPRGSLEQGKPVKLVRAVADVNEAPVYGIEKAIDGNSATFWGIYPAVGKSHRAVFTFATPVGYPEGTTFVVEIEQRSGNFHNIGRFRLSLSDSSPKAANVEVPPEAIVDLIQIPAAERTPEQADAFTLAAMLLSAERALAQLPKEEVVYAVVPAPIKPVHLLTRGDPAKPGVVAQPGSVAVLTDLPGRFESAKDEGARRAALAEWLASPRNSLTWRTMANRIWLGHFGAGIVSTPNDFGKMGGAPSHPELLDWLAAELRDTGSMKRLHRIIMLSATYRQQVRHSSAADKDADNRLLWRMNRRRLEAEAVRDAALLVADRLDVSCYGPPEQHFTTSKGAGDTPIANYDDVDFDSRGARRRSIYRFVFRTRPDPFLAALDCPDFSLSAPVRTSTVSAPQALALWNNAFMLEQAHQLSRWIEANAASSTERVRVMTRRLFGREPTAAETKSWSDYANKHGWANLARVLLSSSEFHFID